MTPEQKSAIEEAAKEKYPEYVETSSYYHTVFRQGAQEVIEHPERYALTARKPIGIQEARELVRQMLDEEISFSRFVELINEGGTK